MPLQKLVQDDAVKKAAHAYPKRNASRRWKRRVMFDRQVSYGFCPGDSDTGSRDW
jgi:hypothetical protein